VPDPRALARSLLCGLTLALASLAAGPAAAEPVRFDTAAGPMDLPGRPTSIVALDVAAIDTLTALGVVPQGVPAPLYLPWLEETVAGTTQVGTLFEPDFEGIAALAPDVIVVGARAAAEAEGLARIAPVADMSIGAQVLEDGRARLAAYGAMLGLEAEAQALDARLEARIADVRALADGIGGSALIVMTNGPKLSVFGAGSRFGWLHTALGFDEAAPGIAAAPHGEPVSFEFIANADPGTLFVIDRGTAVGAADQAAAATLDTPLVAGTRAAREGRIVYLSSAEAYVGAGGVGSTLRLLDQIAAALGEG